MADTIGRRPLALNLATPVGGTGAASTVSLSPAPARDSDARVEPWQKRYAAASALDRLASDLYHGAADHSGSVVAATMALPLFVQAGGLSGDPMQTAFAGIFAAMNGTAGYVIGECLADRIATMFSWPLRVASDITRWRSDVLRSPRSTSRNVHAGRAENGVTLRHHA